jgi:hypothetical protein
MTLTSYFKKTLCETLLIIPHCLLCHWSTFSIALPSMDARKSANTYMPGCHKQLSESVFIATCGLFWGSEKGK